MKLPIGTGDPSSADFDQRTLVAADGKVVEVRFPWALLGYSDPSSLKLYKEHPQGRTTTLEAGGVAAVRFRDLKTGSDKLLLPLNNPDLGLALSPDRRYPAVHKARLRWHRPDVGREFPLNAQMSPTRCRQCTAPRGLCAAAGSINSFASPW